MAKMKKIDFEQDALKYETGKKRNPAHAAFLAENHDTIMADVILAVTEDIAEYDPYIPSGVTVKGDGYAVNITYKRGRVAELHIDIKGDFLTYDSDESSYTTGSTVTQTPPALVLAVEEVLASEAD